MGQIVELLDAEDYPTCTTTVAEDVWRGVSAAIIARASKQLLRASTFSQILSTQPACELPTSTAGGQLEHLLDMGTIASTQPSPMGSNLHNTPTASTPQTDGGPRQPRNDADEGGPSDPGAHHDADVGDAGERNWDTPMVDDGNQETPMEVSQA